MDDKHRIYRYRSSRAVQHIREILQFFSCHNGKIATMLNLMTYKFVIVHNLLNVSSALVTMKNEDTNFVFVLMSSFVKKLLRSTTEMLDIFLFSWQSLSRMDTGFVDESYDCYCYPFNQHAMRYTIAHVNFSLEQLPCCLVRQFAALKSAYT